MDEVFLVRREEEGRRGEKRMMNWISHETSGEILELQQLTN
jgi:hypothetical protein